MMLPGSAVCGPGARTDGVNLLPLLVGPPFSVGVVSGELVGASVVVVVVVAMIVVMMMVTMRTVVMVIVRVMLMRMSVRAIVGPQ